MKRVVRVAHKPVPAAGIEPAGIADRLLGWYAEHGRSLPWRGTRDPYRIWLSEIMLQQTTVTAVIPYYERFLKVFPSLRTLAEASLDQVIELWAGLGYYSRARNLHRAALLVAKDFAGEFPDTLAGLVALPGVGRSTAGAILSLAFDLPAPILDGNVRRVLIRLFAWDEDPRSSRSEKQLWQWAGLLMSAERPHDYAQAIMDLGATVCTPRDPQCADCPCQGVCLACLQGRAAELPVKRPARVVPVRHQAVVLIHENDRLRVTQRPPEGLLGGLWEFPAANVTDSLPPGLAVQCLLNDLGYRQEPVQVGRILHVYSHFKLELTVYAVHSDRVFRVAENEAQWRRIDEMAEAALHGAHRKAFQLYLEWSHRNGRSFSPAMAGF